MGIVYDCLPNTLVIKEKNALKILKKKSYEISLKIMS